MLLIAANDVSFANLNSSNHCGGRKTKPTSFFYLKFLFFQPISRIKCPINTLRTLKNQYINPLNQKKSFKPLTKSN